MTRAELEARRLSAIPDLQSEMSQRAIAKRYGVSRRTIYQWKSMLSNGENGLKARKAPGRPPRMTPDQIRMLRAIWKEGPGIGFDHWTARRFAEAIQQHIDIEFSHDHVGRIMHKLGLR
jgi:transposase